MGLCGVIILSPNLYLLATEKNYYGFPAVTECRICDKTVWEWQSYERREFKIAEGNYCFSDTMMVSCLQITGSGLVHKICGGNPVIE